MEVKADLTDSKAIENLFDGKAKNITRDIVFSISENKKIKLRNIYFKGNDVYSNLKLRMLMKETKQQRWYYFWRTAFDKDDLELDKEKIIGIEKHEIDTFSTVSKEIAIKMAKKVKEKFNSDYSIAVTGNAGPGTDGPGSFVGDCFIAVSSKSEIFCEKYNFVSSREDFIKIVTDNSFKLFVDKIINQ